MPRRPRRLANVFTTGNLVNLLAIPVLSAGIVVIGFYYTTGDTLKRHDEAIIKIETNARQLSETEQKARDEARKQFMESQTKIADVLTKFEVRLAVQENKQETANKTLEKIADELGRIVTLVPRR